MKQLLLLTLLLLTVTTSYCRGQQPIKKDTINFLVDLEKIPANDRIITIEGDNNYRQYNINCPCLASNSIPVFVYIAKTGYTTITADELKKIPLINITALIKLVKQTYIGDRTNRKYIFYFIENEDGAYIKRKVIFSEPRETNDAITVKPEKK